MVKLLLCSLLLFSLSQAFAIEGTITVLEAPLFGEPNDKSKIIQHVRKGSSIYIHDAEASQDDYQDLDFTKEPEEFTIINKDLFITDKQIYSPKDDSKFYKTIAKSGREAYVLKEHVFLEYKDRRELTQKVLKPDNTDYRIEEPLGKDYPLVKEISGYRGQTTMALGQPNYKAYPFKQQILDTSFTLVKEFNFTYSKVTDFNYNRRLYFGAMGGLHFSSQDYLLESQRAEQANNRIYLGPYLSYDIFRNDDLYFTTYTSIHFLLYDTMELKMRDVNTSVSEARTYQSLFSLQPNVGANINFPKGFFKFDTVFGFNIKGLLPKTYKTSTSASNSGFWQKNGVEDSFEQPFRVELTYFFGVQSNY
jgi:hypothetical protein